MRALARCTGCTMLALLAAGPSPEGISIAGQAGTGKLQYGGCGNNDYTVKTTTAAAEARVHTAPGFKAVIEGSVATGDIKETRKDEPDLIGRERTFWNGNLRAGWEFPYGGFEAGAGLSTKENGPGRMVTPSFSGWSGVPQIHGWLNFGAGPSLLVMGARPTVAIGIGHSGPVFDAQAGVGSGLFLTALVKANRYVHPGIDVRYVNEGNWAASLRMRFVIPLGRAKD